MALLGELVKVAGVIGGDAKLIVATAGERLAPGEWVSLCADAETAVSVDVGNAHGIVDPFLLTHVEPGQRFWLLPCPTFIVARFRCDDVLLEASPPFRLDVRSDDEECLEAIDVGGVFGVPGELLTFTHKDDDDLLDVVLDVLRMMWRSYVVSTDPLSPEAEVLRQNLLARFHPMTLEETDQ